MEKKVKIGVICFDLQNFTADFLNRLQYELREFAEITAYPIINNIGDVSIEFKFAEGESLKYHRVKTYANNSKNTPEGILVTPNYINGIKAAFNSDIILHYGIHSSTALISGFLGFILRKKQISINQTLPVLWEKKRKWWIRWSKFIFFRFCSLHIYQSHISKRNLVEVYNLKESKLRYAPFEAGAINFKGKYENCLSKFERYPKRETKIIKYLFVGNLLRFKGVFLIIDAFNILFKNNSNIHLNIVGPESIEPSEPRINELINYANNLGLNGKVEILGQKNLNELAEIYENSDVFVLPTMKDCFPKVLVEAAITGKPLITSDACGAIETIVIDNFNGFIFKSGDVEDLSNKMKELLDKSRIEQFSKNTEKLMSEYLSIIKNESSFYSNTILELLNA